MASSLGTKSGDYDKKTYRNSAACKHTCNGIMLRQVVAILERRPSGGHHWLLTMHSGETVVSAAVTQSNRGFRIEMPESGRWRPQPIGQFRPLASAIRWSFERPVVFRNRRTGARSSAPCGRLARFIST